MFSVPAFVAAREKANFYPEKGQLKPIFEKEKIKRRVGGLV